MRSKKPVQASAPKAASQPVAQTNAASLSCAVESGTRRAAIVDDALRRFGKAKELSTTGDDKDLKTATDQMVQLTQDYPWFAVAHRGLAQLQSRRGNWIGSYTAYNRSLGFPSHPADREQVAAQLRLLEERQPALKLYGEGERSALVKDWVKAEALARQVIDQKPQFPLAHRLLGDALAQRTKRPEAAAAYEAYLRLEPFAPDRERIETWLQKK